MPSFRDASAAIATRFVVLSLTHSWLGREDTDLEQALLAELPGILNWSLDGLARVTERGRLTEPASAAETAEQMADLASPHLAFVRERCDLAAGRSIGIAQLFAAWRGWCSENGHEHPGTVQRFMRDLRAAAPSIDAARPRVDGERVRVALGIDLVRVGPRTIPLSSIKEGQNFLIDNNKEIRGPTRTADQCPHGLGWAHCAGCVIPAASR